MSSSERYLPIIPLGTYQPSMPEGHAPIPGGLRRRYDANHGLPKSQSGRDSQNNSSRMTLVLFATSAVILSMVAGANVLPQEVTQTMNNGLEITLKAVAIMDDERLRWWCVIGAFCGAWVNVGIFRPRNAQEIIWKWVTSFFASIIFIPAVIEYLQWGHTSTVALSASGLGAIVGWTMIHTLAPLFATIASSRISLAIKAIFGVKDEDSTKSKP